MAGGQDLCIVTGTYRHSPGHLVPWHFHRALTFFLGHFRGTLTKNVATRPDGKSPGEPLRRGGDYRTMII